MPWRLTPQLLHFQSECETTKCAVLEHLLARVGGDGRCVRRSRRTGYELRTGVGPRRQPNLLGGIALIFQVLVIRLRVSLRLQDLYLLLPI